ncbi:phenylacrylic acid decarboxylase [Rhodotorula kratochvilovae]
MLSHFHLPGSAPASRAATPASTSPPHARSPVDDPPFQLIPEHERRKKIVVAVTGATGTLIAIRLLEALRALDIETHLILSKWALQTMKYETDMSADELERHGGAALERLLPPPRSADVCLKEGRRLMLCVRETPLSDIHLENMLFLRRAGAIIFPPLPAYYIKPESVDDLVNQTVGRMLDSMGIHTTGFARWSGGNRQR